MNYIPVGKCYTLYHIKDTAQGQVEINPFICQTSIKVIHCTILGIPHKARWNSILSSVCPDSRSPLLSRRLRPVSDVVIIISTWSITAENGAAEQAVTDGLAPARGHPDSCDGEGRLGNDRRP